MASREARDRMERARERDRREAEARERAERAEDEAKERSSAVADAEAALSRAQRALDSYKPSRNLSDQSAARARRNLASQVAERQAALDELNTGRPSGGRSAEPSLPGELLQPSIDFIDELTGEPEPYAFGPPADGSPTGRGRVGALGGVQPVVTGDEITDATMAGVGGATGMTSDPLDIFLGLDPFAKVYEGTQTSQQRWADRVKDYVPPAQDQTTTVGDLFRDFYALEGDEFRDLQYNLFIGGFYGDVDPRSIAWGTAGDEATEGAWQQAVVRSARFYAANRKLTVDDVIALAAKSAGADGTPGPGDGSEAPKVVHLTDPAALSDTIDTAAQKVLGRKANAEERRLFVAAMHEAERTQQIAAQSLQDWQQPIGADMVALMASGMYQPPRPSSGGTTEIVGVSPDARADEMAREFDPLKADARKVVGAAQVLSQMLKGQI